MSLSSYRRVLLAEDYEILDKLFDRTKYGVEIEALAVTLADEFIQNLQSKGGIDGAIQKMTEAIAEGQDLLPEVSPELKQMAEPSMLGTVAEPEFKYGAEAFEAYQQSGKAETAVAEVKVQEVKSKIR